MEKKFYTPTEVAKILNITPRIVLSWIKRREIKYSYTVKATRKEYLIPREELERLKLELKEKTDERILKDQKMYTTSEVAQILGVNISRVRNWVHWRKIFFIIQKEKGHKRILIPEEEIKRLKSTIK